MNMARTKELREVKGMLDELKSRLERMAEDERFSLECGESVSECCYCEAEAEIWNIDDAGSRLDEAIELIEEVLA